MSFSDYVSNLMASAPPEIEEFKKLSREEMLDIIIKESNEEVDEVGMEKIPCDKCHGKGVIYSKADDTLWWKTEPCTCSKSRRALDYVDRMGLTELVRASTFDRFIADNDFTKTIKSKVTDYLKASDEWLYLGGQSGCGKTHLAMAVFGQLVKRQKAPRIMLWIQDSQRIKSLVTDEAEYDKAVRPLQTADYLIIDDFFNCVPTQADIKLARTIIDYRYTNKLPTIITSELLLPELNDYDDAICGRIVERCGNFCIQIGQDMNKNYRMRGIQTL